MSNLKNFMEDNDKVNDLLFLSRIEFFIKHKDITEEEYNNTINRILVLINASVKQSKQQREIRNASLEEFRKRDREYKRKHKDKYNARRREKYKLKKELRTKPNQILKEYEDLHKEEIEILKAKYEYEKKQLYQTLYYYSKTKKKRQEAKANVK